MKGQKDKFRLILVPFLVIAVSFISLYTLLNWLLIIRWEVLTVKEDIVKFWVPFFLPFLPVLLWLRPRIKLLRFKNDNGSFGFQTLAAFAIAVPTIFAQQYLDRSTGKLTPLRHVSEVSSKPASRFYTLQHCFVDKSRAAFHATANVSGKHNKDLDYALYLATPILDNEGDTALDKVAYWLGKKYHKTISNKLSDKEKDDQYRLFAEEAQAEFDTAVFERFAYLEKAGNTEDHDQFNEAIKSSPLGRGRQGMVFLAHTGAFADRAGNSARWIFLSFGIGVLVISTMLLFIKLRDRAVEEFKSGKSKKGADEDVKEMLHLVLPRKGYVVTPLILNVNLLIYLVMIFSGLGFISFSAVDLLHWGGNFRPSTTDGEYWRLLTSIFLHGGLMHLLANMVGFLFVGVFLEPILGTARYALAYLVSGILGSCASLWWHKATVSVGASGAIFGIYGLLLALLLLKAMPRELGIVLKSTALIFVGYNLLMGFVGAGIDNAAHIGGLLGGFVLGLIMAPAVKNSMAVATVAEDKEPAHEPLEIKK